MIKDEINVELTGDLLVVDSHYDVAADLDAALAWAKKAAIACDVPGEVRELLFYPAPEKLPGGSK